MARATLIHHHTHASSHHVGSFPIWDVSEAGVERLLELSADLPLDGEVTPVQIWNQIRRHPLYERLDIGQLERLKAGLLQHVKCYGYVHCRDLRPS